MSKKQISSESPVTLSDADGYTVTGEKRKRPYSEEEKEQIRKYCEQHDLDPNRVVGYNE